MSLIPEAARGWVRRHLRRQTRPAAHALVHTPSLDGARAATETASRWVPVAPLDALLPRSSMTTCTVERQEVMVIRSRNDRVFAYLNACPHMGASLSDGHLRGHTLTCRRHGHKFRATDGTGCSPYSGEHLARVPARVTAGILQLAIALPTAPPQSLASTPKADADRPVGADQQHIPRTVPARDPRSPSRPEPRH